MKMGVVGLVSSVAAVMIAATVGCVTQSTKDGESSSGGTNDAGGGDGGSGVEDGSATGDGGATEQGPTRYACPIDKPQKVYGYALNAKSSIDTPETWTPDNVYLVFGPLHIQKPLTIQAGTVVCFDYGPPGANGSAEPPPGEMLLEEGGAIDAQGTPTSHVVFTAKSDGRGPEQLYWKGLTAFSGWTGFKLVYSDIYNGGLSAGGAPLEVMADNGLAPLVDWQNVKVYSSQRVGIKMLAEKGFTPETKLTFVNFADEYVTKYASDANYEDYYDHGYPVLRLSHYGASSVKPGMFDIGDPAKVPPATRYVQLDHAEGAIVSKDYHLHKLPPGLAWRNVQNELLDATLTIDPGTTIAVANGGTWFIGDKGGCSGAGSLVAVGTAAEPITFTNDIPWQGPAEKSPTKSPGITINSCAFASTKLDYVVFDGLGAQSAVSVHCKGESPAFAGEVNFLYSGDGVDREGPPITHSTFKSSAGYGILRVDGSHITTDYTKAEFGNTFEGFTDPAKPAQPTCN